MKGFNFYFLENRHNKINLTFITMYCVLRGKRQSYSETDNTLLNIQYIIHNTS